MPKIISLFLVTLLLLSCSESSTSVKLLPLPETAIILAFGDSLTQGVGVNRAEDSYPSVLSKLVNRTVINAGISGETSQYGLERLPKVLNETSPDLVILCHGGNDLLRRLDKQQLKSNLEAMILAIKESGAQVVLVSVPEASLLLRPPSLYQELADKHGIAIQSDIVSELQGERELKSDQIHFNERGYALLADSLFSLLQSAQAIHFN